MAAPLMISISGIRGIAGISLTPEVIIEYIEAFVSVQRDEGEHRKLMVVGQDSRVSGEWVKHVVKGTIMSRNVSVVDIGVVPTPTVQLMVKQFLDGDMTQYGDYVCVGGVIITASHNSEPWNGLKFVDKNSLFLSPAKCEVMFKRVRDGEVRMRDGEVCMRGDVAAFGKELEAMSPTAVERHIACIMKEVRVEVIRKARLKVVVDAINGAGGETMRRLMEALGVEQVWMMNMEPSGRFAHGPEPVAENLTQLSDKVREVGADVGIAVDPDTDRCVLVAHTGEPLGEEYTLALAVDHYLGSSGRRGVVCKNLSTSRAVDDVAAKYGCRVVASPVGEIHVAGAMVDHDAVIGGEGNGGVMLPSVHIGRDAPVAAALILQALSDRRAANGPTFTLLDLKAQIPDWFIVKSKMSILPDFDARLAELQAKFERDKIHDPSITVSNLDGLRIDTQDYWLHIRKSNTEPIARIISEAQTLPTSHAINNECIKFFI